MPAQSTKRIQVGFSEVTLKAIEGLAEAEGLKLSRVCSILVEEALVQRGWLKGSRMKEVLPSDICLDDDSVTTTPDEPMTHEQAKQVFGKSESPGAMDFKMKKLQMMEALMKELQQM